MNQNSYYMKEMNRQQKELERMQKAQVREYNRQQREIQREGNRQQKAYIREVNRQQKEYEREVNKYNKAEQKRQEKGQAVIQSVSGNTLSVNDLKVLGFNDNIIASADRVISYLASHGVNKFDFNTIGISLHNLYGIDVNTQVNLVGFVMYLIKVKRTQANKELSVALNKVRSAKEFDSYDAELLHSVDVLVRHYNYIYKHFGVGRNKISNRELFKPVNMNRLNKLVMVDGIKDKLFSIYNSSRYMDLKDKCYVMVDNNGTNTTIKTNRMPVVPYGVKPKVDGVGEVRTININSYNDAGELQTESTRVVAINNKYVRMLNRFAIFVSTRKPGSHCGMVEIICAGGTRIYVYADIFNDRDMINKSETGARVYDYGYFEKDLLTKLAKVYNGVNRQYGGIMYVRFKPIEHFKTKLIPIQGKQDAVRADIMKQNDEDVY